MSQLSPLPIPVAGPEKPTLSIELVPFKISLAPGQRYFIGCKQGDRHWFYPIQFTELEISLLVPRLEAFDWSLTDSGVPSELDKIHAAIEAFIGGKVKL